MNVRRHARGVAAAAASIALVGGIATTASARPSWGPDDVAHVQKFYDNSFSGQDDYILMGGPADLAGWCGGDRATVDVRVRETPSRVFLQAFGWLDIQLYEANGMSAPEFLDTACGSGVLPEPVGTGTGWLDDRIAVDVASDTAENPNSLTGSVLTGDGTRLQVRGYAVNHFDGPEVPPYPVRVSLTVSAG